jgi:photosystem II stability/assembly factor-like uncharacterized protein
VKLARTWACALAAVALAVAAAAQSTWQRQSPFPTDRSGKGVFAIAPDRALFVGENRLILQTQSAGQQWTVHQLQDWGTDPFYAIHFTSPTNGVITGNNEALRTTDGGATWTPVPFFAGSWSYLDFIDSNIGFAGANGALAATTNGGQSWSVRSGWPDCPVIFGMDFRDANVGLVGGVVAGSGTPGIFKTIDGGRTWVKKAEGPANDVLWMSPTRAIADDGEGVRETLDAGETWHGLFFGTMTGIVDMAHAGAGERVVGVSGKGDVWLSTDSGRHWAQTLDGPGALPGDWQVSFSDEGHGWIVGPGGFYYYTSDAGVTWVQKHNGCTAQVWDIQMWDANYGLAVGHNGYVFKTVNGGSFWEIQKLEVTGQIFGRDEDLVAVDIVDASFAVVAGPGGTVFKTYDAGATWTSIGYPDLEGEFWIYDVDFIDRQLGYVYGVNAPVDQRFLFRTRDGGATWEWVDMGNIGGGFTAQFIDAQTGWLTADNDFGWRTMDGGANWTSFRMPQYYSGPEVSKVRFLDRNVGWAVGWNGYLAKTTNGGVSWSLIDLGTIDDHLLDVVPVSSTDIWLCGREESTFTGFVYHTTNGGQSWSRQVVTDWFYFPYRMTALPSGDAWFAGYAGSIFRRVVPSTDVLPQSAQLQIGVHVSGGVPELLASDNAYYVAKPRYGIPRQQDRVMLVVEGTSPSTTPSALEFKVECRVTDSVQLRVEFWNFQTGAWEEVHFSQAALVDTEVTVTAPAPASRYIDVSTRKVRARLLFRPADTNRLWIAYIDRTVWRVVP